MKIGLFNDLAIGEWEQHEMFLDKMDSLLAEDACSWNRKMDQKAQQVAEECRADFDELRSDYSNELSDFKIILTNSLFVYSYSLFENSLIRMCKRSQAIHNSSRSIKSRAGIIDAKKYMKRLGVAFPCNTAEWREIQKYRLIRNAIAHNGGIIPSDWCECKITYADENGIVKRTHGNLCLELTRSFCDEARNTYKRFLLMVLRVDPDQPKSSESSNQGSSQADFPTSIREYRL